MGKFKIEITGTGGSGVDRNINNGGKVNFNDGGLDSPDALAKKVVEDMKAKGVKIESAVLVHNPGEKTEVRDDLITRVRTGTF